VLARILNSLLTGGKTLLYSLAGLIVAQALVAVGDLHFNGVAGLLWKTIGAGVVIGILKSLQRLFAYKVEKDPAVVGPLVPLAAVPTDAHPTVLANVRAIKAGDA
jgi:hypothetical protein